MTPEEKARKFERLRNLSPEKKAQLWERLKVVCADICDDCGGSIAELDHTDDCGDPDAVEWRRVCALSDEEVEQELRADGYDLEAGRKRFRALLDRLEAEAIDRITSRAGP